MTTNFVPTVDSYFIDQQYLLQDKNRTEYPPEYRDYYAVIQINERCFPIQKVIQLCIHEARNGKSFGNSLRLFRREASEYLLDHSKPTRLRKPIQHALNELNRRYHFFFGTSKEDAIDILTELYRVTLGPLINNDTFEEASAKFKEMSDLIDDLPKVSDAFYLSATSNGPSQILKIIDDTAKAIEKQLHFRSAARANLEQKLEEFVASWNAFKSIHSLQI